MKTLNTLSRNLLILVFHLLFIFTFSQTRTWTGGTSNVWTVASNWNPATVPTASDDVLIPSTTRSPNILTATSANAKSVTIQSGATLVLANSVTALLNIKENFTNNGTLSAGAASTITFDGAVAGTIGGSSAINFGNLTINKSANANTVTSGSTSSAFGVQQILNITRGNLIISSANASYTVGDNLDVGTNGTLTHDVDWDIGTDRRLVVAGSINFQGTYVYPKRANIQMTGGGETITTGTTALCILTFRHTGNISASGPITINDNWWISYNTTGSFTMAGQTVNANSGVLLSGGTFNMNGGTLNVSNGLRAGYAIGNGTFNFSSGTINADFLWIGDPAAVTRTGVFNHTGGTANFGDVTITNRAGNSYICSTTGPQTINVSGNWTNNQTFTDGTASTVNFTGTGPRTINGTLSGTTGSFYNLTFNGVGGSWTNNATIEVANTLTMTNGILNTAVGRVINVTRAGTTAAAAITGGSDVSYVNGPLLWSLRPSFSGLSTYNFPVGKGGRYLPFSLVNPTTTGVAASQVEAFNTNSGGSANFTNPTTAATLGSISNTEYWSLATAGNFSNSSVSLARPEAIVPFDNIAGSTTVAGVYSSLGGTVGTNGISTSGLIGTNRFFTFGRKNGIRINGNITPTTICASGAVNVPFVVTGAYTAGNVFTAQLSDASGSFASPTNIGNLPLTLTGNSGQTTGVIAATIPNATPAGTGYRIRVVSSVPDVIGENNGVNLAVTAIMTAAAPSLNPSICIGSAIPTITIATARATGIGTATGLPAGVTATFNSNTITLTGTPTISGVFNYSIPLMGGCGSVNATGTITVMANMTAATPSSSPTLCINAALPLPITIATTGATGIGVATNLPAGVTATFSSNTITLTGTPTASGIFNYSIPLTGGCGSANATGTITVTANMTAAAASSNPTLCINTALPSAITIATTGATGIGATTNLPVGVTATFGSNTITLTGAPTASGTFNYSIPLTGGCGSVNATGTINVNANNTVAVSSGAGSNNQSLCIGMALPAISFATTGATNIGSVSDLPAGVSASFSGGTISITGTPTVSGVFNYSIPLVGGCGNVNATGTIKINAPTVFNGTWSDGLPDGNKKVVFASDYSTVSGQSINACSCEVQSTAILRIGGNSSLTVQHGITNLGSANNLIVETDGNLIQINPSKLINSGNITAERIVTGLRYNPTATIPAVDFIYWGSPVTGQLTKGAGGFSPGTLNGQFADYRESNNRFYETADATFIPGKGYSVQAERNITPVYTKKYEFKGAPNNGDFTRLLLKSPNSATGTVYGYNLIANPYPSNINFNELYLANSGLIWNTAWFWTNATYQQYQAGSNYSGNNYAIYNGTGGVPATSPYNGGIVPDGIVKVAQGFMVQAKVGGNLEFKNSYSAGHDLRVLNSGTFVYKQNNEKNRYSLRLIAPTTLVNTQLIGYVDGATNDFEKDYDALSFGLTSDLFYSVLGNSRLLIQGRDSNFTVKDKIILGANFFQSANYTIELGIKEGIFANGQNIYLKDKQNNVVTNLSQGSYTFAATAGDNNSRFEIIYEPKSVLATDDLAKEKIVVYRQNEDFVIRSSKDLSRVEVYDPSGKLIKFLELKSKKAVLDSSALINGIYILKIQTKDGEIYSRKVLR